MLVRSSLSVHRAPSQTLDVTGDLALRLVGVPRKTRVADAEKGLNGVRLTHVTLRVQLFTSTIIAVALRNGSWPHVHITLTEDVVLYCLVCRLMVRTNMLQRDTSEFVVDAGVIDNHAIVCLQRWVNDNSIGDASYSFPHALHFAVSALRACS